MQTFLPHKSFSKTAAVLDYRRLGKQRVETYQIMKVLSGESTSRGWQNHPAVNMWRGYEGCLAEYGIAICEEWLKRGYRDSLLDKFKSYRELFEWQEEVGHSMRQPNWLGTRKFHAAHRSNLLRKQKEWYSKFGWAESDDLPYIWPV